MTLFNNLTVRTRLISNLLLSLLSLLALAVIAVIALTDIEDQTQKLNSIQQQEMSEIARFQQTLIKTTQLANEYMVTLSQNSNKSFNQSIDVLKSQTEALKTHFQSESNLPELDSLNSALRQYKKATNSNVFLSKEMENTVTYGIDRAATSMEEKLAELMNYAQSNELGEIVSLLKTFQQRLVQSQLYAGKLVSSARLHWFDKFHQAALGDFSNKLMSELSDTFESNLELSDTFGDLQNARDEYYESFGDLKDYLVTKSENNRTLIELVNEINTIINSLYTQSESKTTDVIQYLNHLTHNNKNHVMIISVSAFFLLFLLNIFIVLSITKPLRKIHTSLSHINETGQFDQWPVITGRNEIADMSRNTQTLLNTFREINQELISTGNALSAGEFDQSIKGQYVGEFDRLKNSFNASIHEMKQTMGAIETMSEALKQGNLSFEEDTHAHKGTYKLVIARLNEAFQTQKVALESIKDVMESMRNGDFSQRISMEMPGDFAKLKLFLNESLSELESAIDAKSAVLVEFRNGNFSAPLEHKVQGKLNELRQDLDDMASHISEMIFQVQHASQEAVDGVKQISMGNEDLNQRVNQQAAVVEDTLIQMQQMVHHVQTSLEHASNASEKSRAAQETNNSAISVVNQMADAISDMEIASREIANFTQVIDDIAFQTNLLALNAAVEAARAGENGKGFAVVAGEVRNLASKSSDAAHNIEVVTKRTIEKVKHGIELSEKTRQAFNENALAVEEISSLVNQMNVALEAQTIGIQRVNRSLEEINEATQKNAALVEEVSQTSTSIIDSVEGVEKRLLNFQLKALPTPLSKEIPLLNAG